MKGVRAAVRYAKAIRQLAQERNILDNVVEDIKLIHNTILANRELGLMLESPLVSGSKKKSVLNSIFGSKVNELTTSFIGQVVEHKRESILQVICEEFFNQYNVLKNIARVSVTTTLPLTKEIKEELIKKIKSDYQLSEVQLEEKIDESLIGGMILRMGDKQLDASIRRQLSDIKQELVQA